MPIYGFRTESGKDVEMFYNMGDAPRIGEQTTIGGVLVTRIAEKIQVNAVADLHFVSHVLPRNDPDAPRVNSSGQPCFESKKEVSEYTAKKEGDYIWD